MGIQLNPSEVQRGMLLIHRRQQGEMERVFSENSRLVNSIREQDEKSTGETSSLFNRVRELNSEVQNTSLATKIVYFGTGVAAGILLAITIIVLV